MLKHVCEDKLHIWGFLKWGKETLQVPRWVLLFCAGCVNSQKEQKHQAFQKLIRSVCFLWRFFKTEHDGFVVVIVAKEVSHTSHHAKDFVVRYWRFAAHFQAENCQNAFGNRTSQSDIFYLCGETLLRGLSYIFLLFAFACLSALIFHWKVSPKHFLISCFHVLRKQASLTFQSSDFEEMKLVQNGFSL